MAPGRSVWSRCLLILATLLLWHYPIGASALFALEQESSEVLVLHSYDPGYEPTQEVQRGIEEAFRASNRQVDVTVEYLDARRYADLYYLSQLVPVTYHHKFKDRSFDLVLVSDNVALDTLLSLRRDLFTETPVVFCGINDFHPAMLEGVRNITGVAEKPSFGETLRTALELHPNTQEIIALDSVRDLTGQINREAFMEVVPAFQHQVRFSFWEDLVAEDLEAKLNELPETSLVFQMALIQTESGKTLSLAAVARLLREASPVPVYSAWNSYLGKGIVGGKLVDSYRQGQLAAGLALRILAGAAAETLAVIDEEANQFRFDYQQLERFGIALKSLPPGSEVINLPPAHVTLSQQQILLLAAGGAALVMVVLVLAANILARKKSEKALVASNRNLQTLIDAAPVAIVALDAELQVATWNGTAETIFGWTKDELKGAACPLLLQNDVPNVEKVTSKMLNGQGCVGKEVRRRRKDGTLLDLSLSAAPLFNPKGRPAGVIGIYEDITERKRSEERIRTLSLAIEHSAVLMMITDPSGIVEYVNPSYSRVTGFAPEELVGRHVGEIEGQDPEAKKEMWLALSAGEDWKGEFRNRRRNGEVFYESASVSSLRDAQGAISHFVKVAEDITERLALENHLRHAQKMEGIGQLAGGVAHDFNNILTAIKGYASLQHLKAAEGSSLKADLAGIIAAAKHGTRLTRDLLAFSRKRSPGHQLNNLQVVDLNAVVTQAAELLQRLLGEKIELIVQLAPGELPVLVNTDNLGQVLMNLGANARDAMPKGGQLSLRSESVALDSQFVARHGYGSPGRYALLSVTDSGCGMDSKTVDRIFEPFFTTKEVGHGTGLGLSITYGIIKQHKGYIVCSSVLGLGTVFSIFLPLDQKCSQEAAPDLSGRPQGGREALPSAANETV
ncbi:PAS domain S-box protein [Trichloromonas sp.]|uniref:PAS domain S-box protein n=1 Tax=Trichloromonas sp. TaxID=3069249 RepID=UPI003D81BD29